MFGRVPKNGAAFLGTRPNIRESHSEISTRVPFCIRRPTHSSAAWSSSTDSPSAPPACAGQAAAHAVQPVAMPTRQHAACVASRRLSAPRPTSAHTTSPPHTPCVCCSAPSAAPRAARPFSAGSLFVVVSSRARACASERQASPASSPLGGLQSCEERVYKGLHAFPSNITRDDPPNTRDYPPPF